MCFYNVGLVEPAFEFCTEMAHMRIMNSHWKCKSGKLQQLLNWEINIEVNVAIAQKLTRHNSIIE